MAETLMLAVLLSLVALIIFCGAGGAEWLMALMARRPHKLPLLVTRPRLRVLLTEQAQELGLLEEQRLARFSENQRAYYTQQIDGLKAEVFRLQAKCDAAEASVKCNAANEAHRKKENAVVRAENKRLKEQVMLAAGAVPANRAKAHAA